MMPWGKLIESSIAWGPGALLAGGIIFALYKLIDKFGGKFIDAQQAQANALASQAASMEALQKSLHEFVAKDNGEHREMLVLMKYTAQHIQALLEMKTEHDNCQNCIGGTSEAKPKRRKKQTNPDSAT